MGKDVRKCKSCGKELSELEDNDLCQACRSKEGKERGKIFGVILVGVSLLYKLLSGNNSGSKG